MSLQHNTEQRETQGEAREHAQQEGIVVPLELGEFRIRGLWCNGTEKWVKTNCITKKACKSSQETQKMHTCNG